MTRIRIEILRGPYQPAMASGFHIESCRILTDVSLHCAGGWTPFRPMIIDTGAPLSLFPRRMWQQADTRDMGRIRIGGVIRKAECMLDVTLATAVIAIRDRTTQLGPMEVHALLADTDDVP